MMSVKIGEAVSMGEPESERITPDDRQQTLEVIGGVVVQDYGRVEIGDKTAWTLTFAPGDWVKIKSYWTNRTIVNVQAENGETFPARVVVKSWQRMSRFPDHIKADLELWRL